MLKENASETCKASILEKMAVEDADLGIFTSCHPSLRQAGRSLSSIPVWSQLEGCSDSNVHLAYGCDCLHLPHLLFSSL